MANKKAWLRIIEASMAILIIASVLIIIMLRLPERYDPEEEIYEKQSAILKQISLNETLRSEILQNKTTLTNKFIENLAPVFWNFTTRVCDIEDPCGLPQDFEIKEEVYVDQILIIANLTYYNPRKFKLFVWMK